MAKKPKETPKKKFTITRAAYHHIPSMLGLAHEAIEESDGLYPPLQFPHVVHYFTDRISRGQVFLMWDDVALIGTAILSLHNWPWNLEATFFQNDHFYIKKEHRGSSCAADFLRVLQARADQDDVPLIMMTTSGSHDRPMTGFMEKNGGKRLGDNFIFNYQE